MLKYKGLQIVGQWKHRQSQQYKKIRHEGPLFLIICFDMSGGHSLDSHVAMKPVKDINRRTVPGRLG